MPEQVLQRPSSLITWALIADARQAQIYASHRTTHKIPLAGSNKHHNFDARFDYKLIPIADGTLRAESINNYQTGHDQRGSTSSSISPTHNNYEPHGDIDEELKRRFARRIADKLQKSCADNLFDRLVLAAPAPIIAVLKDQWSAGVIERITAIVPKGLVQYQGMALMAHLRDALAESHVD